jgi:DNA end-binding protein Ku
VAIESKRTIEIAKFVPRKEIVDEIFFNSSYYIVPDDEVGAQAFAVIREAIKKEGMVSLGEVVFTSRVHIIALEARGKDLMGVTLRYAYEVRKVDNIPDEKIPKNMLDLAGHIVDSKARHFDPQEFEDQYESVQKDLLERKQTVKPIERPQRLKRSNVVSLMDALRQSLATEGSTGKKPAAPSSKQRRTQAKRPSRRKAV